MLINCFTQLFILPIFHQSVGMLTINGENFWRPELYILVLRQIKASGSCGILNLLMSSKHGSTFLQHAYYDIIELFSVEHLNILVHTIDDYDQSQYLKKKNSKKIYKKLNNQNKVNWCIKFNCYQPPLSNVTETGVHNLSISAWFLVCLWSKSR